MPTPPSTINAPVIVESAVVRFVIRTGFVVVFPPSVTICRLIVAVVSISAPLIVEVEPILILPLTPMPPSTTTAPVFVEVEFVCVFTLGIHYMTELTHLLEVKS
jgi:hypothetical protein